MSNLQTAEKRVPVYVPWKSLANYIGSLKSTTVPHTLDNSVMPKTMSGGLWRQILSALRFLGLLDQDNLVSDGLASLVSAHGTKEWESAIKEHVLPVYEDIIGDLPIENATAAQLNDQFRKNTPVSGQMLDKCVRFYVHALKASGTPYSSHFSMRSGNGGTKKPRKKSVKRSESSDSTEKQHDPPPPPPPPKGTQRYPLYFKGKPEGALIVPEDLSLADCKMIKKQLEVLEAYAGEETE